MSQLEVSKAEAAEERSEQTRSFVRTVKAAARRKYTPEEKTPNCSGGLPPRGHSQRPVPAGGDQAPLLLLVDQRVHGGGQGEVDP